MNPNNTKAYLAKVNGKFPYDKIQINKVRNLLGKEDWENQIMQCNYRQFDVRWIILNKNLSLKMVGFSIIIPACNEEKYTYI